MPSPPAPAPAEALEDQISCPLCDYNLRGLPDPRCPECGYQFSWDEVRDPARRLHPYLFEHQSHRPIHALTHTLLGGLRPKRFWRTLHPVQPSRPGPLALYLLLFLLLAATPLLWHLTLSTWQGIRPPPAPLRHLAQQFGIRSQLALLVRPIFLLRQEQLLQFMTLWLLALPLLNLGLLLIFQISLRRARLKFHHLARCIIYSYDIILWFAIPLTALITIHLLRLAPIPLSIPLAWACLATIPAMALLYAYRLGHAYARYLRLPRAWGALLLTQLVLLILLLNSLLWADALR